jgi:hypothetical protein
MTRNTGFPGFELDMRHPHTGFPGLVTLSLGSVTDNPLISFRGHTGHTAYIRFKSVGEKYSLNLPCYVLPVLPE